MNEPTPVNRRPRPGASGKPVVGRAAAVAKAPRRKAQVTAARLLASARRLFLERGYAATPLTAVAEAAGVSVETLYVRFGSKRGLLAALMGSVGEEGETGALLGGAVDESDPREQLRLTARVARRIYEASWDVVEILRHAGTADSEVASAWHGADERARAAQAPLVRSLAAKGALRPTLSEREAADVLWALSGPDVYRMLAVERAWSGDRYERWLADSLAAVLLAQGGQTANTGCC
jgi:AcrR family transcriptional regulator